MTSHAPVVTPPPVTAEAPVVPTPPRRRVPGWVPWAGGVALAVVLYVLFAGQAVLPHNEDAAAFGILRDARDWVDAHRNSSPIFLFFINYIRLFIDVLVTALQTTLHAMGWPGLIVGAGALGWALGGWRLGLLSLAGFTSFGVLGVWDMAVDTLALVIAAVLLSLLIGLPLGVWAGRSERVRRFLTPILDVMQIMPTFAYLAPMTLFFLIGAPSATVATMIYSIPPAIRIAALGIREVSPTALEASRSIGATKWQTLFKVQIPMARTTILLAVNQTIMMAISMVVITALIDAPGLGEKIISALTRVNTGSMFDGGIAIVIMAIVLDRMTRAHGSHRGTGQTGNGGPAAAKRGLARLPGWVRWAIAAVVTAAGVAASAALPGSFPSQLQYPLAKHVNDITLWIETNWFAVTDWIKNVVSELLLNPLQAVLTQSPWWLMTAAVFALALGLSGLRAALTATGCLLALALLGLWQHSMETLTMVLVATVLTVLFGLALGILAARYDRFATVLRPVLDAAQTMPSFVYLLPALALFSSSRFTAIAASVIYAVPPVARLVEDGLRAVPATVVEAATSAGSTYRQLLWKVQLPMARGALLLALNQGIIMVLAVVVVGALVGAGALGYDVVAGFSQYEDFGKGFAAGIAIVLLGVMLDRITQGSGSDRKKKRVA
ncbi:ABC transporter permease subunit [Thermopolyspora sp. NPDC052614]|uniref:ABC transporter permease n=1 Tax=Thermopolyspora sp. NPDC052614 TaxID=3155682 RepID=UPI00341BBCF2